MKKGKIEIIPAVLPRTFSEVEEKISLVKGFVKVAQIDVCDGQFVPQASWPYRKHDDSFERIIHEEQGLPFWENVEYEIDLMANKPETLVNDWMSAGVARIIIHAESAGDLRAAVIEMKDKVEIGMAMNIATPLSVIETSMSHGDISFIQCMGIDHIGFQGQKFNPEVLNKIAEIAKRYPELPISVDGGVSFDNMAELVDAGATRLVVGSAIFGSDNPIDTLENMKRAAASLVL